MLNDGVLLFNALDGEGRDAVAHELLDSCDDHPMQSGTLHHHDVPSCIVSAAKARSTFVGYAVDGFGIYVERNAKGQLLTNTDLDACHGRTSKVLWNGKQQAVFHYDATLEYPVHARMLRGPARHHQRDSCSDPVPASQRCVTRRRDRSRRPRRTPTTAG